MIENVTNDNVIMENVEITYKRFIDAKPESYFDKTQPLPYLEIHLDPATALSLISKGWDVWTHSSTLRVHIFFKFSPNIIMITKKGKTSITSYEELAILADVDFKEVDIAIQPYKFNDGGKTFKKACVSSLYVTIKD